MPDKENDATTYIRDTKEALAEFDGHIEDLKKRVLESPDTGADAVQVAYLLADAKLSDADVNIVMGCAFDPITFGQILAATCAMSPDIILGLMEGLVVNEKTREVMNQALMAMMSTIDPENLAATKPEGSA